MNYWYPCFPFYNNLSQKIISLQIRIWYNRATLRMHGGLEIKSKLTYDLELIGGYLCQRIFLLMLLIYQKEYAN